MIPPSLGEGMVYLDRIDALAVELADDMALLAGDAQQKIFMDICLPAMGNPCARWRRAGRQGRFELRNLGKALTEAADDYTAAKARNVRTRPSMHNHIMPAAFLSVFLLLMALVIQAYSQGVLRHWAWWRRVRHGWGAATLAPLPQEPSN